jgi:SAM-dependent methyltransferase
MSMDVAANITVLVVLAVIYLIASLYYPMLAGGAAYSPTPRTIAAEALYLAGLKNDEVFYDLGCGTGEVLIAASKLCDHVKGVEIEPIRWFIAKLRARKAKVILGNLFNQDISDADVVFLFQYEGTINDRIAMKIKAETRSGTRVISYLHPIENLKLVKGQNEILMYTT